jgi:CSLREA domain-containing protein
MKQPKPSYLLLALPAAGILLAVVLLLTSAVMQRTGRGQRARAGSAPSVTVNSTANADDGACQGLPNDDVAGGACTLREAINEVNSGGTNAILFEPRLFTITSPSMIDLGHGAGCLPDIERSGVTVDMVGAGVILDGDGDGDGARATCQAGIVVALTTNGFDFTLTGNDHLLIRNLIGNGVMIDCMLLGGPFAPRHINVTGVRTHRITGVAVIDDCPTPTPTPTLTPTPTTTPTPTNTPTSTSTPTITPTPTPTWTPTSTATPSNTSTSTHTATSTRTPTRTPTITPTPRPPIPGDANCDGVISSIDAVLILQYVAGLLSPLPCAANGDIDHDGSVTSLDAALILQLVAELL